MGEEMKKPEEAKIKVEEEKKVEEALKADEKPPEEKKSEDPKAEQAAPPPPPPPQEIVLKVFMHCEGCARKVRRCLKGFQGVEEVITDCKTSKVVVKGEKAAQDPLKVLERVQKKSHRQVELISPIPKPPSDEPNKAQEKEVVKVEDKKEEIPMITVVLGVYMHCEACAQEIKKRIMRMKGVESAEPDLKSSQVTVKGKIESEKLIDYVHKRTGKHAVIVKTEPEKKEEEKAKQEEKKEDDQKGEKEAKKDEEIAKENKEGADAGGGGGAATEPPAEPVVAEVAVAEDPKMELKKNEFYQYYPQNINHQVYPQRFVQEYYNAYPPQIFSDENPNACTVM